MGYPFQWRFLERGIIFRTHESSSFVISHWKLFKDRLLLRVRFNALTSKLLYSCCTLCFSVQGGRIFARAPFLERGISFRVNSRTGYQFEGKIFLERGANLESQAAHTHPKNTQVPPGLLVLSSFFF